MHRTLCLLVATLLLALAAPALGDSHEKISLYDRLGGKDAITAVVDRFVDSLAADERVADRFGMDDPAVRKRLLVEQICEATGGPCKYSGRDMKTAHRGYGITNEEFDITAGHLVEALDYYKVPDTEKEELMGAISSMRGDIVERE